MQPPVASNRIRTGEWPGRVGSTRASVARCRLVLLAIVVVAAGGCSSAWQVRSVTDVGNAVSLDITSCNATYDVASEETADRVTIAVQQVDPGQVNAECADELRVELEQPLGDRDVVVNGEQREIRDPSDPSR